MPRPSALLLVLLSACLNGCGYHLGASKQARFQHITKIAVPMFINHTQEPRISAILTDTLIKRLQMDGTYQIVSVDDADAILKATIESVSRTQARTVATDTIQSRELRVMVKVDYDFIDAATSTILVKSKAVGDTNIVLGQNFQLSERQGISDTAERIAIEIIGQISEGW